MSTKTLFRPVGQKELDLVTAAGYRAFPPRLPEQPIFYPVLTRDYAEQIARQWNTKDERSGFVGYVLEFDVETDYVSKFEVNKVGNEQHMELWISAEELPEFNRHIRGVIRVVAKFANSEAPGFSSLSDSNDSPHNPK
jgi:hypothetical protein